MIGRAVSYGAVTVINAISCGYGAALGVNLKTEATVKLTSEPGRIEGRILSDPDEDPILIRTVVRRVLEHFKLDGKYGAYVETSSNIPIARGLKSSSAAANAIALATFSALRREVDDITVINLGVDASIEAKVTITGAFDDACASYLGGLIITDNIRRRILRRVEVDDYKVLIYVPAEKSYTISSDTAKMKIIAGEVKAAHELALSGKHWEAMTINGLLYSTVLGFNPSISIDALSAGAVAAGLSGKGPAVAAVVPPERIDAVKDAWTRYKGEIIEAEINNEKASIIE